MAFDCSKSWYVHALGKATINVTNTRTIRAHEGARRPQRDRRLNGQEKNHEVSQEASEGYSGQTLMCCTTQNGDAFVSLRAPPREKGVDLDVR